MSDTLNLVRALGTRVVMVDRDMEEEAVYASGVGGFGILFMRSDLGPDDAERVAEWALSACTAS